MRLKWLVVHSGTYTYLRVKPKKVRGGYLDKWGGRYIGRNVRLYHVPSLWQWKELQRDLFGCIKYRKPECLGLLARSKALYNTLYL